MRAVYLLILRHRSEVLVLHTDNNNLYEKSAFHSVERSVLNWVRNREHVKWMLCIGAKEYICDIVSRTEYIHMTHCDRVLFLFWISCVLLARSNCSCSVLRSKMWKTILCAVARSSSCCSGPAETTQTVRVLCMCVCVCVCASVYVHISSLLFYVTLTDI